MPFLSIKVAVVKKIYDSQRPAGEPNLPPSGDSQVSLMKFHVEDSFKVTTRVCSGDHYVEVFGGNSMPQNGEGWYLTGYFFAGVQSFSQRDIDNLRASGDYLAAVLSCEAARSVKMSTICDPEILRLLAKTPMFK